MLSILRANSQLANLTLGGKSCSVGTAQTRLPSANGGRGAGGTPRDPWASVFRLPPASRLRWRLPSHRGPGRKLAGVGVEGSEGYQSRTGASLSP